MLLSLFTLTLASGLSIAASDHSVIELWDMYFSQGDHVVLSCLAAAATLVILFVNWRSNRPSSPRRSRRNDSKSSYDERDEDSEDEMGKRVAKRKPNNNNVHDSDSQVADDESEFTNAEQTPSGSPNPSGSLILSRRQKKNRKLVDVVRSPDNNSSYTTSSSSKKNKNRTLYWYKVLQMTDEQIYQALKKYVHHQEVLRDNCFPIESTIHSGSVFIYQDKNTTQFFNDEISKGDNDEGYDTFLNPQAKEFTPKDGSLEELIFKEQSNQPQLQPTQEQKEKVEEDLPKLDAATIPKSKSSHTLSPTAEEFVPKLSPPMRPRNITHLINHPATRSYGDVGEAIRIEECSESRNKNARECLRCSKTFFVSPDGVYLNQECCVYHWGKFKRSQYRCCYKPKNAPGCTEAALHVWKGLQNASAISYFNDFVVTKPKKRPGGVFSLDAEMAFTAFGLELVRLTVVGLDGRMVYEAYVMPEHDIVDYNTRFSGLNAYSLNKRATKTLKDVQNDLMGFVAAQTILIGHGLENDLRVLKLVHSNIIDTSIVFMEGKYRHPLKSLVKSLLNREIQSSSFGHDSFEDAAACMELMLYKVSHDCSAGLLSDSNVY